jgi:hypothetical protein
MNLQFPTQAHFFPLSIILANEFFQFEISLTTVISPGFLQVDKMEVLYVLMSLQDVIKTDNYTQKTDEKAAEQITPTKSHASGSAPSRNGNGSPRVSESRISVAGSNDGTEQRKVAERSQMVIPKSGPPQVLLENNSKGKFKFQRCDEEPIRIPGAVQNFGALLGMKYTEDGTNLEVRIASENTRKILGYGPEQLFALPSFLDVLKDDVRAEMVARIEQAFKHAAEHNSETRLEIFQIVLTFPYEPETHLWCAIHIAPNPDKMVVCEFEEYVDAFYLKDLRAARNVPDIPVRSMGETAPEDLKKSTTSASKPLPVLEIARQRKHKEFSSLDLFNALAQAQKQITNCNDVQAVLEVVVGIISELTGFHRVMFYRFDPQKNGCVDAELLNPQASTDVFLGRLSKYHEIVSYVLTLQRNALSCFRYPQTSPRAVQDQSNPYSL